MLSLQRTSRMVNWVGTIMVHWLRLIWVANIKEGDMLRRSNRSDSWRRRERVFGDVQPSWPWSYWRSLRAYCSHEVVCYAMNQWYAKRSRRHSLTRKGQGDSAEDGECSPNRDEEGEQRSLFLWCVVHGDDIVSKHREVWGVSLQLWKRLMFPRYEEKCVTLPSYFYFCRVVQSFSHFWKSYSWNVIFIYISWSEIEVISGHVIVNFVHEMWLPFSSCKTPVPFHTHHFWQQERAVMSLLIIIAYGTYLSLNVCLCTFSDHLSCVKEVEWL